MCGKSLDGLCDGTTEAQILDEHPDLEKDDFPAVWRSFFP
jgi:hypothetical protein